MNEFPYTMTDTSITTIIDGKKLTVNKGDERYVKVRDAIRNKDFDAIVDIMDLKGRLISESNGGLYLLNGILRCEKYTIPALLANRITKAFKEGFDITPITMFLENLMENPNESGSIIDELYGFIEACELPITADGHFLAYKMVNKDFTDIYTGSMDNSVGSVVEMDRARCDFNRGQTCSTGLHFCSEGYLGHYGTRHSSQVVIVKVNPRDVTSIPTDYDNAKGRACKYEIVDAISWDDTITPWFTDEYSDFPEEDLEDLFDEESWDGDDDVFDWDDTEASDEIPFAYDQFYRWEVRDSETDEMVDAVTTRQQARDLRNSFAPNQFDYYIWDTMNDEVVAGVRNNEGSFEVEPDEEEEVVVNGTAKLNEDSVKQIRKILKQGAYDSIESLARMFGVSARTIGRIRDWKSWTHVYAD